MNHWLIYKSDNHIKKDKYENQINLNSGYCFDFTLSSENYYYNDKIRSGVFVFGYYINRVNSVSGNIDLKYLFNLINNNFHILHKEIKGIFTIIIITNGDFSILNDPFGISKVFFNDDFKFFADRIQSIKVNVNNCISTNHILEYYVFNYMLNGNTFFDRIKYATPGYYFSLTKNGKIRSGIYFDILDYLSESSAKLNKKEVFNWATNLCIELITQLQKMLNHKKVSLTLTAGLDSRILLGSFIRTGYSNFDTFTFGHKDSLDVDYAIKLADEYNIKHKHIYPNDDFFAHFSMYARKVFEQGDTLVSIYRAHRFEAYNEVMSNSNAIVMGLAGSDLVRGYGYDGLIVSPIAFHCWNKKSIESYLMNPLVVKHLNSIGFGSIEYLLDNRTKYDYLSHNIKYLFKVVIPLHFSQDIVMNANKGWKTIVPFLDLDYIEFLRNNSYLQINDYTCFKRKDLKRRIKGLYYSADLSYNLSKEVSSFSTGKGYSPKDVARFPLWAFTKGYYNKIIKKNKNYVANFSYGEWFWNYLDNYFVNNNLDDVGLNHTFIHEEVKNIKRYGGEFHFLDFVKAINIHMASKI